MGPPGILSRSQHGIPTWKLLPVPRPLTRSAMISKQSSQSFGQPFVTPGSTNEPQPVIVSGAARGKVLAEGREVLNLEETCVAISHYRQQGIYDSILQYAKPAYQECMKWTERHRAMRLTDLNHAFFMSELVDRYQFDPTKDEIHIHKRIHHSETGIIRI